MSFLYNPLNKRYNLKGGYLKCGSTLTIKVDSDYSNCNLMLTNDSTNETVVNPLKKVNGLFTVTLKNLKKGLYFYYFECDGRLFGRNDFLDAVPYKNLESLKKYQLTVYDKNYKTPDWLKGGVIYQIFPDRFNRSFNADVTIKPLMRNWGEEPYYLPNEKGKILNNDFFGGNFKGIEEKLPYLKELGVTALYLNPVSLSYSNHRYDTADYLKLDSLLGSEKDFKSLIDKAHENGIKIIFDGVYNHTGDDSVYFNKYGNFDSLGAYQSKNSPYYNWYTFEKFPYKYVSWWGIDVLPTINKNSTEFEDFITQKVLPYYFSFGVDGVRLDVVDELPTKFVKKIRKAVKNANENAVIIGEVWEDATNKIAYSTRREYFQGNELDSVMNYPLKNAIIDCLLSGKVEPLAKTLLEQVHNYPKCAIDSLMNILSTHDTARILTVLSGEEIPTDRKTASSFKAEGELLNLAVKRLKVAYALLFTLYGVPTIYYGDEVCMQGAKDPFNRRCMNFQKDEFGIFYLVKKLCFLRKTESVFNKGEFILEDYGDGILVFKRFDKDNEVTIIINVGNYTYTVEVDGYEELLSCTTNKIYNLDKYSVLLLKRRQL